MLIHHKYTVIKLNEKTYQWDNKHGMYDFTARETLMQRGNLSRRSKTSILQISN